MFSKLMFFNSITRGYISSTFSQKNSIQFFDYNCFKFNFPTVIMNKMSVVIIWNRTNDNLDTNDDELTDLTM
jgi:hypothetical protein